jgi:hypothetical protein
LRCFFAQFHKKWPKVKKTGQSRRISQQRLRNAAAQRLIKLFFHNSLQNENPAIILFSHSINPTIMKMTNSFRMKTRLQSLLRQVLFTCLFVSILVVTLYVLINSPA